MKTSNDQVSKVRISALCLFRNLSQALPVCGLSQSGSRDDERGRIPIFNTQGTDTSTPVTDCSWWRTTTNALYLSLQMLKTVSHGTGLLLRSEALFLFSWDIYQIRVRCAQKARGGMDCADVFLKHWTCEDAPGHLIFFIIICVTLNYAEKKYLLTPLHTGMQKKISHQFKHGSPIIRRITLDIFFKWPLWISFIIVSYCDSQQPLFNAL